MTSLNDIRTRFLQFFASHGHEIVPSSPLVPRNDPTLMFTNAGMVQFKNVFTGAETRSHSRAASSQKCVRAGGKHNDLDNVGYTARHHTFFEMLGNFSFGDYFKEDAIRFAWDLVSKDFGLDPARLLVTVYAEDEEAASLWRKIAGFPDHRVIRIPTSDNFWSMGDTGPCGPCSEIFYDYGEKVPGGPPGSADADGDRFVEFWNLVFMQYEQLPDGRRVALPRPSIDTGMGLERMASILQGQTDNYDTDLFRHLIAASAELARSPAGGPHAVSHRVIADHLRASAFLIADGVLPSNEGRGYVLRRIMRRAMRHVQLMGVREPMMWRLVPVLLAEMGRAYPELMRAEALIAETLRLEETRFRQTLERGLRLLDEEIERLGANKTLPGDVAFRLYDTFGFPLDLTQDALRMRGLGVDTAGFTAAMERQKAEARKAWAGSGEAATDAVWFSLREELGATEFLGYETEAAEGQVVALLKNGQRVDAIEAGAEALILTNQTPFYGESGGQVGDTGAIFSAAGAEFAVGDTEKKLGALHVHRGTLTRGRLRVGEAVEMRVDGARRRATRANHSATHLLHAALKHVLGEHVSQKGSLVAPERLRFDFSHPKAMSADEIATVETEVNRVIQQNEDVLTRVMPTDQAIAAGAVAMFGEKYGDEVRVLTMGHALDGRRGPFSVELCGGTHVRRLGDIAIFKIVTESAVAAGVRRVEAVTGDAARAFADQHIALARDAAAALKVTPGELPDRLAVLLEERKRLERELADAKRALALGGGGGTGASEPEDLGGISAIIRVVEGVAPKDLRNLIDEAKQKLGSGVVAFVTVAEGKASIAAGVTADLADRLSAVDLVKAGVEAVGGKGGGGRPDMAQGGGPNAEKVSEAVDAIKRAIQHRSDVAR
ncbi:MAG: alanine--tRNA ligase [Alphaproteobacteria bacterium]|nr:alanine--tRNA ligase [Alphaproteobacteria bacterium]